MLRRRRRQQQRTVISKFTGKQIHSFLTKNNEEKYKKKEIKRPLLTHTQIVLVCFFSRSLSLFLLFLGLRKS